MDPFDKFYALSAPVRREIIKLLSTTDKLAASVIAEKFHVSAPAISQHLKILLSSDLVVMQKDAQKRIYSLNRSALKEIEKWTKDVISVFEDEPEKPDKKNHTKE